jgi:hypothetical protein
MNPSLTFRQLLLDPSLTRDDILKSFISDPDWELIEWSDTPGFKATKDDCKKCPGGVWWFCKTAEKVFQRKPVQKDIDDLLDTINYPDGTGRPECTAPCKSVQTGQESSWALFKNKINGDFGLHVAKSREWTCQTVVEVEI